MKQHPLKPNATWSNTEGRLRRKDVDSPYVDSFRLFVKTIGRRLTQSNELIRWMIKFDSYKQDFSAYHYESEGNRDCSLIETSQPGCLHPDGPCTSCKYYIVTPCYKPTWIGFMHYTLKWRYTKILEMIGCFIHGHDLQGCGEAGPDSGNMAHTCTRCESYFSVPLY